MNDMLDYFSEMGEHVTPEELDKLVDARNGLQRLQNVEPLPDLVNAPPHYTHGPMEVIDVIEGFELPYHLGNVVKYVLRYKHKGGVEDLKKARWYLDRFIERGGK